MFFCNYLGGLSALLGITLKSPQISPFFSKKRLLPKDLFIMK